MDLFLEPIITVKKFWGVITLTQKVLENGHKSVMFAIC